MGSVLAWLSSKVLGQYEAFTAAGTPGRLILVAPNIVETERRLGVDPHDFRLWVALHEVTHRTQFTAVPWMHDHVRAEIGALLEATSLDDPAQLLERLKAVVTGLPRGGSLVELLQTPEQRVVLDRVTAFMSLLEGHAEHVMDGVGPSVVPSVRHIRKRVRPAPQGARRRARPVLRRLLGLDLKALQYAEGKVFVDTAVRELGMDRLQPRVGVARDAADPRRDQGAARLGPPHRRHPRPHRLSRDAGRRRRPLPVRVAVRRALRGAATAPVAAAVSGGADSLALAAALAFERPGSLALVVDHGLQAGSARGRRPGRRRSAAGSAWTPRCSGQDPRRIPRSGLLGIFRAAAGRRARGRRPHRPLRRPRRRRHRARAGGRAARPHPRRPGRDGAARAGPRRRRPLAGRHGATARRYLRPLLGLDRATVRRACAEAGLAPWEDPHNADPSYARVRVRERVLPVLEAELGPGVAAALARTAAQLREDADALDAPHPAHRRRRRAGRAAGCAPGAGAQAVGRAACGGAVTAAHVDALRALVDDWRGQGPVALPGGTRVERRDGRLACLP